MSHKQSAVVHSRKHLPETNKKKNIKVGNNRTSHRVIKIYQYTSREKKKLEFRNKIKFHPQFPRKSTPTNEGTVF